MHFVFRVVYACLIDRTNQSDKKIEREICVDIEKGKKKIRRYEEKEKLFVCQYSIYHRCV